MRRQIIFKMVTERLMWGLFLMLLVMVFTTCENAIQHQMPEKVDLKTGALMVHVPIPNKDGHQKLSRENDKKHAPNLVLFMDKYEVTNAQFESFVNETGYITVAERDIPLKDLLTSPSVINPMIDDSIILAGSMVFKKSEQSVPLNQFLDWWEWVPGTSWKHPLGPDSDIAYLKDHPVVHVAWEDAHAYCTWAEKRLPTVEEWTFAAKGGNESPIYPWGNEDINSGTMKANFWQGLFPVHNTLEDAYEGTAPVGQFPPNGFGLHDLAGNVWEFTSEFIHVRSGERYIWPHLDPDQQYEVIIKGGSFLCNDQYCSGYRIDQKMTTTPDTGAGHLGFRCVKDSLLNK